MSKIIWVMIGINTAAWVYFIAAYFVINSGKNVDSMERGWTFILALLGLVIILLAAVPLHLNPTGGSLVFSGIMAALPLAIALGIFISKQWPAKKQLTYARTYYEDKKQLAIAAAIENNDTVLLKRLIKGADLNIQGIRVWNWPGLNYIQFAVRIRSNPVNFPFDEAANDAAIRILLQNGCDATPALPEAVKYLSPAMVGRLIAAGADLRKAGFAGTNSLLFNSLGSSKQENDMLILLVKSGADANVKDDYGKTLLMAVALSAGTSPQWNDAWRLVYYLLAEAKADYAYIAADGRSFPGIISNIREEVAARKIATSPDFDKVVAWLKQRNEGRKDTRQD